MNKFERVQKNFNEIMSELENTADLTAEQIVQIRKYIGQNVQIIYAQLRQGLRKKDSNK